MESGTNKYKLSFKDSKFQVIQNVRGGDRLVSWHASEDVYCKWIKLYGHHHEFSLHPMGIDVWNQPTLFQLNESQRHEFCMGSFSPWIGSSIILIFKTKKWATVTVSVTCDIKAVEMILRASVYKIYNMNLAALWKLF